MAIAIISLATHTPVRPDIAMTGEITLRGRILPVGGVRDKALAAMRSGITTVILPSKNLDDLRKIPKELKRRVKFIPVDTMDDVLEVALEMAPSRRAVRRARSSAKRSQSTPASAKSRH
jgi:ATP-dependent Lon protease